MTFKRKAVPFDTFVGGCNYFDSNSDVNNGYGCTHPEQEEKQKGKGCCFCFSCPLGTPADEESFEEPDIDWNGTEKEDVGEDDYIIIPSNCENQDLTEVEKMIRKGDKVIMNGKYYVSEKNKDKEFIVTTEPTEVCGTLSVWLEGFRGCYAVDGLTKVGSLN